MREASADRRSALHEAGPGSDLLVTGRCPQCEHAVTELLAPAPRSGLDQTEYLALLGALGLLTGLALTAGGDVAGLPS